MKEGYIGVTALKKEDDFFDIKFMPEEYVNYESESSDEDLEVKP